MSLLLKHRLFKFVQDCFGEISVADINHFYGLFRIH
ncbi:unnamed protein product [Larinioides sclopetarius]|uniref:Maturase K n=1 Tax=Larinioides sclopetarius TaxID=280406 RepID=A0AAV2B2Q9_9ARAC